MITPGECLVGQCRVALVCGGEGDTIGVDTVVAACVNTDTAADRIKFTGPVDFTPETRNHLTNTVLPAVDAITEGLGLPVVGFTLSAVNLGAASIQDVDTEISGYSADAAIFLAMLSAALTIPIPENVLVTGHVASPKGELRPVRYLREKLEAAARNEEITRFIYAAHSSDRSVYALNPAEAERLESVLGHFKGLVECVLVNDVGDLVKETFFPQDVVSAALRKEFYARSHESGARATPTDRAIDFLLRDHEAKFWDALSNHLFAKQTQYARQLLEAWTNYHLSQGEYPQNFGQRFTCLLRALPRTVRRTVVHARLIPPETSLQLARLARLQDISDVQKLIAASTGRVNTGSAQSNDPQGDDSFHREIPDTLEAVLSAIEPEALAAKIRNPIDAARASYVMDEIVAVDYDEFLDVIVAYYHHLVRQCGIDGGTTTPDLVHARALDLVTEAFANRGGFAAARVEARDALNGGLRLVLDAMTDALIKREQLKYVNAVLVQVFDPLEWEERVALTKQFMTSIAHCLPVETLQERPERYARAIETLVRIYVDSMEQVRTALRAL